MEQILEKVLLVSTTNKITPYYEYQIEEMTSLCEACNMEVVNVIGQIQDNPNPKTYLGKGKINEVLCFINNASINTVVVSDSLTPAQIANMEQILNCTVIDRTMLILLIFERRATTANSLLQVKIAKLKYMLPRLQGTRSYMSRSGGGSGSTSAKGAGEKQIDLDKRKIEREILKLESDLKEVEKNSLTQNKKRLRSEIKKVSFVGYTNVGKSSLMNKFIEFYSDKTIEEKKVFEKNMLFATLDTSTRLIKTNKNHELLISDTVGFVSNLPHTLISSFKETLKEAINSDLILLVLDASSPTIDIEEQVTIDTLNELSINNPKIIKVYNKADLVKDEDFIESTEYIYTSTKTNYNIDKLMDLIDDTLFSNLHLTELLIPFNKGDIYNILKQSSNIINTEYTNDGIYIKAELSDYLFNKYIEYKKN